MNLGVEGKYNKNMCMKFSKTNKKYFNDMNKAWRGGSVAKTSLSEDLGSISNNYMAAHNCL